jgi:hypothetical protein
MSSDSEILRIVDLMTMHTPNSDAEVRDIVLAMIRELTRHRGQIDDKARLLHDLSISGDDAWDLLSGVQKRFGTTLSGMNFEKFFPNESESIFYRRGRFLGLGKPKRDFSLGHLLRVIKEGRWLDPSA